MDDGDTTYVLRVFVHFEEDVLSRKNEDDVREKIYSHVIDSRLRPTPLSRRIVWRRENSHPHILRTETFHDLDTMRAMAGRAVSNALTHVRQSVLSLRADDVWIVWEIDAIEHDDYRGGGE